MRQLLHEAGDQEGKGRAQHRQQQRCRRAALAVRLRQNVARADIEQETREEAQIDRQPGGGNREEQRRKRAKHWGGGIQQQQSKCATAGVMVDEHQRNRI